MPGTPLRRLSKTSSSEVTVAAVLPLASTVRNGMACFSA